jgi:hypothetical protein
VLELFSFFFGDAGGSHLLDEVDFAVVFAETGADELVVVEAGVFADTYFLEGWPDAFEVGGEFVCCVCAGVGYEDS